MSSSTLTLDERERFVFQKDLINTNGRLQSLVIDMRYHCEVYKLSLRSINNILKHLQKEHTPEPNPHPKYTVRSHYRRDIILVSQKRALEKINCVLRKARNFINGYSLLEKATVETQGIQIVQKDSSRPLLLLPGTQPVRHPLDLEKQGKNMALPIPPPPPALSEEPGNKRAAVVNTVDRVADCIEELGKVPQSLEVEDIREEGEVDEAEAFIPKERSTLRRKGIGNTCKSFRLDGSTVDKEGKDILLLSSYPCFKNDMNLPHESHRYSRSKKYEKSKTPPSSKLDVGRSTKGHHSPMGDHRGRRKSDLGGKNSFMEQGRESKIETVQSRPLLGDSRKPGAFKQNRESTSNNINNNAISKQAHQSTQKLVSSFESPRGLGSNKSSGWDQSERKCRESETALEPSYPEYQGKIRRIDIDSLDSFGGSGEADRARYGCGMRYKTSSYWYRYPLGLGCGSVSPFQKKDTLIGNQTPLPESSLQNSKITTTLIAPPTHNNNIISFLQDPRLVKKRIMEQIKETSGGQTGT